jgi:iron complex outermembrane receptor protein
MRVLLSGIATATIVSISAADLLPAQTRTNQAPPPVLRGVVTDSSGVPLPSARVTVTSLSRTTTTDDAGRFVFRNLVSGTYHVTVMRIGFAPAHVDATVPATGPDVVLTIKLRTSALELSGVQVTATPLATDSRDVAQAVTDLSTAALARGLSSTVAQTLSAEPGISVRFNGPAAAAPVIRGLQGDRVLVLQDGDRTGDLASSAPDHAVSVDPLTADRVEVVRGPASLLYGNQALGGVVNVISNDIPSSIPTHIEGSLASQAESATPGAGATLGMTVPINENLAIIARGGGRRSDNLRMGGGEELANSFFRNYYGLGGIGFGSKNTNGGVIYRYYHQNYGLPSGEGERSRIDGGRQEIEGRSDFTLGNSLVSSLRVSGTAQWYSHDEVDEETNVVNTSFNLRTQTLDLLGRTKLGAVSGAIGASGILKQYASTGDEALTPAANSNGAGAFIYEEIPLRQSRGDPDALLPKLQIGGRYDVYRIRSIAANPKFGSARNLSFNTFSGSVGVNVPLNPVVSISGSVARAFRAPTVEELFSNAFHAALGTFDVGNPSLEAEVNQGGEIILRAQSNRVNAQLATYRNAIQNFITPNIVKDTVITLDGEPATVPLNRITQADASMYGAEGRLEVEVVPHFVLGGLGDVVRGHLSEDGVPLPYIPPARLGALARWDDGVRSLNAEFRHAFSQDRVPPPASEDDPAGVATDAFNLVNLSAGYVFNLRGQAGSMTVRVDNLFDEKYRDATSRIKLFAFNPGRNFSLMYKVLF